MRIVVQRVKRASVTINSVLHSQIGIGLLILLGVSETDREEDANWLAKKVANLRIFSDDQGNMNRSIIDTKGEALVVSQFTLHASTKRGNRPSFIKAAKPEISQPLYQYFSLALDGSHGIATKTGIFGADMQVELINDGPVTIIIDTDKKE